ncbi:MAG: MarR family transcriptional regulator [Oscillospiraceae bacterium]|nr:MarR family transcriptional regulator [Oscillospiraceae bacterium]
MDREKKLRLSWNMDRLAGLRRHLINREADENGIYLGQHRVVRYIGEHPGCSQREIAAALSQTPAAITLSTKRLQEIGLITKETDPSNLRQYHLYVTEKGVKNGESFLGVIDRYADITFAGFSDDELEQLSDFIERMQNNLRPLKEEHLSSENNEERKE